MITTRINHPKGNTLVTSSMYDSGTHCGFDVVLNDDYSFSGTRLNDLLTDKEIKSIELVISSLVKGYLEDKE